MKMIGETVFDIAYLVLALGLGVWLLRKAQNRPQRLIGAVALLLGGGDTFHLVPRIASYFTARDLTAALGFGKLVTSVTMTFFYIGLYYIWLAVYQEKPRRGLTVTVWALAAVRTGLCLLPQNRWLTDDGALLWGILRNVPFVLLGGLIVVLFARRRKAYRPFRLVWLYVTLSFLFYLPVVVGADAVPMLGMLMLPKTVCYILIISTFKKAVQDGGTPAPDEERRR